MCGHATALALVRNQLRFLSRAGAWCNIPPSIGTPCACLTTNPPHTVRTNFIPIDYKSLEKELANLTPKRDPDKIYANFKKACRGKEYLQFSLSSLAGDGNSTLGDVAAALRVQFPSLHLDGASANDAVDRDARGTTFFVGGPGHGTGPHVDVSAAVNLALAFSASLEPLAYWLFVRPDEESIGAVSNHLRTSLAAKYPDGLFCPHGNGTPRVHPVLCLSEMHALVAACPKHARIVEQRHGDAVLIPVGWIHSVINEHLCLKVAFDRLVPGDLANVALCQRLVSAPVFGRRMVEDCVTMFKKLSCELEYIART
jgi:hypothetical protein